MIVERIFGHARAKPDKPAIYDAGRKITYREFASWIAYAHEYLGGFDLSAGTVAAVNFASPIDSWVFDLALRHRGLTTIAVPDVAFVDEIGLKNVGCILTTRRGDREPPKSQHRVITIPAQAYLGHAQHGLPLLPETAAQTGGHILLTSGTTGVKKKVLIGTDREAIAIARRVGDDGLSEDSIVNVSAMALWTGWGYKLPSCAWSMGATVVIHNRADYHRSLLIDGITHTVFTPEALTTVLRAPDSEIRRYDAMWLIVGGGQLTASLAAEAARRLTPHVHIQIGSTEVGTWAVTRIEKPEDLRSHRLLPSIDLQVVDDGDRPLPPGRVGEIRLKSPDIVTEYLDDEAATRMFLRNGWFYPGDLGRLNAEGRLELHGRITNVINILGNKLPAEPIEQALQEKLGAEGVCVFSARGQDLSEELHVAIHLRRAVPGEELAAIVSAELSGYPYARVHFVEALPRNDMGKIDRRALRRQFLGRQSG